MRVTTNQAITSVTAAVCRLLRAEADLRFAARAERADKDLARELRAKRAALVYTRAQLEVLLAPSKEDQQSPADNARKENQ